MKLINSLLVFVVCLQSLHSLAQGQSNLNVLKYYKNDGISLNSYNFKGLEPILHRDNDTTYVINFWATWCKPCVEELPTFEKINHLAQGKKIKVILISLDMKKQVESHLMPFLKKRNIQSEVLHLTDPDANVWIEKVDADWSGALPATLIYKGTRRAFYEQSLSFEALRTAIQPFYNL